FGRGAHPATRGALVAIDRLARRRRFRRVLDVGSGSGVLAIAAAKAWPAQVTAVDVNPVAVDQARRNFRANALGRRARAVVTYGLRVARLPRGVDFDLAVANLDAKGLLLYAAALSRGVAPGGMVVLTGLGKRDERRVAGAYRALGLRLRDVLRWDTWSTLVMEAPRSPRRATTQRADRRLHRFGRARR
ncbi:MAG: 50S ribosomal protein L11 methyltransferase, partial [Proteobacteria bacterium]|nr:50S ribosomal protein L11 methyltransferase [Pseudomonadota bacterium]